MPKQLLASIIFLLIFPVCVSQMPKDFPVLDKDDLPGASFLSSRSFNGSSLFGYINGGAELYLEYGFNSVLIIELEYLGGKYKTEIYKMNGPEEAFGIFSVSKFHCSGMPALSRFTCQTKYQLQICKGPYYISIINRTGTRSDSIVSLNIGKIITDKIMNPEVDLSLYLPGIQAETIQTKTVLAKGRLGVVNGTPDLEDFFQRITDYTAVILKSNEMTIISVKFRSNESYLKFLELHHWEINNLAFEGIKSDALTVKQIAQNHLLIELPGQ